MIKMQNVYSFLLCTCAYLGWSCTSFLFQANECHAKLIISFQFADGGMQKIVPSTGGNYTVNIMASTDNPLTNNLGVNAGYIGALSQILNSSIIDGDIAASAIVVAALQAAGSNHGAIADVNADGRIDMGFANGTPKNTSGWMRPTTGSVTPVLLGGPAGVIGTFTVTIPAYAASSSLDFLSYSPQLDPSGVANDWSWSESNSPSPILSGSVSGTNIGVITGSSVTFTAVPEPATWSMLGIVLGVGFFWRRRA